MATTYNDSCRIPLEPGQAVSAGWTSATGGRPLGVTWHWTATWDLALCRDTLGGAHAERKGEASAHYGVGRTAAEGVDRYVALENRSWHAGINQTLRWDGQALTDGRFKGSRTTIGVETVDIGNARSGVAGKPDWILAASADGKHAMRIQPWPPEQIAMMVDVGQEIVARWPQIRVRDHHGHSDICPGYKIDPIGFPFALVLRGVYDDPAIPDVWTPLLTATQRQNALIAIGTGRSEIDWGHRSDGALHRFQAEHGMVTNGMWSTFTCWKVFDALEARRLDLAVVAGSPL